MKQINVISDIYKNIAVNFNGFIVKFDIEGKGIIDFDEKQTESIEKIFEMHPNIYKGDELPKAVTSMKKEECAAVEVATNVELEHLKESNKTLALENASLKKENEILKKEKIALEDKLCTSIQDNKIEKPINKVIEENIVNKDEDIVKEELNKKTIAQLKEILNTEDFLPFKEEWKGLVKKEDIINYILNKIEDVE